MPVIRSHTVRFSFINMLRRVVCLIMLLTAVIHARGQSESELKAIFIYNFTSFIEWPTTAFEYPQSPFVIGVYGKNVFGNVLERALEGEKVNGHPLIIRYIASDEDAGQCHILYIDKSSADSIPNIISAVKDKPVLTVSDAENFMERSGILRFYTENSKIRLQINQKAAERSGLSISAKLLRLATIYNP
jgi:hypothetical protein